MVLASEKMLVMVQPSFDSFKSIIQSGNGNTVNERTQLELDMTEIAEVEAKRKVTLNLEV